MEPVSGETKVFEELKKQILEQVDLSREVSDEEMQDLIDEVILAYGRRAGSYGNYGQRYGRYLFGTRGPDPALGKEFLFQRTDFGCDSADDQRLQPGSQRVFTYRGCEAGER